MRLARTVTKVNKLLQQCKIELSPEKPKKAWPATHGNVVACLMIISETISDDSIQSATGLRHLQNCLPIKFKKALFSHSYHHN